MWSFSGRILAAHGHEVTKCGCDLAGDVQQTGGCPQGQDQPQRGQFLTIFGLSVAICGLSMAIGWPHPVTMRPVVSL